MARQRAGHDLADPPCHQSAAASPAQPDGSGAGRTSRQVASREAIRLNPADAAARGIADGDVVRVFNARGACLAGAIIDDGVLPQVAVMSTGAWLDVSDGEPERGGNPNVLTLDIGTSRLSQGSSALSALIEIERWTGAALPVRTLTEPLLAAG